jgi:endonuclease YncB( thermonuclease family)
MHFVRTAIFGTVIGLLATLAALPAAGATRKWTVYDKCELIPNDFNDGDSFHVRCKRRHYVFRLCFVDAPETDRSIPGRLTEQAQYWDIKEKDALRLGKEAARFTGDFLKREFKVYTKREDARGRGERPRYFAMVEAGGKFLSMALVENGLARIYGKRLNLPNGLSWRKYKARLETAERKAKREGQGAWGLSLSRPGIRLPEIEPRDVILTRSVAVYSFEKPSRLVQILPRGSQVKVLKAESVMMVRVSFDRKGEIREAKCRRADLGL